MMAVAGPKEKAMRRYSNPMGPLSRQAATPVPRLHVRDWRAPDQAGQGRREERIAELFVQPRTQHRAVSAAARRVHRVEGQGFWVADRADLGDVAPERQAGGPVDHGAGLAGRARDLAHVVGPRHPPGGEAAEGAVADLPHGLVAAEVDEGGVAAVLEGPRRADAELGGDVASRDGTLAHGVLSRGRTEAAARVGRRGAVADRPD